MENAELYSAGNGMQRRDAEDIIREFRDHLGWSNGARILDVGCGTGEVTASVLLPHLPVGFDELVALDVSHEMIHHAKHVYSHPKVTFVQFDVARETKDLLRELNAKLESNNNDVQKKSRNPIDVVLDHLRAARGYDTITSFYCLHWINDQRLALENIRNLLKPGGDALLVLLAQSPIFSLYDKLSKHPIWKDYMQDVDNFISPYHRSENPLKDFTDLIDEVGFDAIKSECRDRDYTFPSTAALRNAIIAVNPFMSRIPSCMKAQFVQDCLDSVRQFQLTERTGDDHRHKVTYKLIVAHIRRCK